MRTGVLPAILASLGCLLLGGCPPEPTGDNPLPDSASTAGLQAIDLSDQPRLLPDRVIALSAARNETVSFALQVTCPATASAMELRFGSGQGAAPDARIDPKQYTVYQALAMPVDLGQAGYIRHTGAAGAAGALPRALLPLPCADGRVDLDALRDPGRPLDPHGRATGSAIVWVDVAVPAGATTGNYRATCTLLVNARAVAQIPIQLTVWDFSLPSAPSLHMLAQINWAALLRLYPDQFQTVTPGLMSRTDTRYASAITTLDQLVTLAQQHRAQAVVERLQPQVKWPADSAPRVEWEFFDSVIAPWLEGGAFSDGVGMGFWPLPTIDYLDRYDDRSRMQYWRSVAAHFAKAGWLARSALCPAESDTRAAEELPVFLAMHPQLRVRVAMEDAELDLRDPGQAAGAARLITLAPGLIFTSRPPKPPAAPTTQGAGASHWLRADQGGAAPSFGSGADENDVCLWAWLAFLRRAEMIDWGASLPAQTDPGQTADPDRMTWFYPGRWFGVDRPLPTVQLKWLRRAEQDYEYLVLARERGEVANALVLARLIARPVEIPADQGADPADALLSGTADAGAWTRARGLLARVILLGAPGARPTAAQQIDLNVDTAHWIAPQEKPLLLARSARWSLSRLENGPAVDLNLGVDVYNAADQRLPGRLQWTAAPEGWQFHPQPVEIAGAVNAYQVRRFEMDAEFDPARLAAAADQPMQMSFANALNGREYPLRFVLPLAVSLKREGTLVIDGVLDDWASGDALHDNAPLVRMLDRPAVQRQELVYAATSSSLYSCWAAHAFYVAFKLDGLRAEGGGEVHKETNFVAYQFGRAWGEDLCELLVQAMYADGSSGPLLHVVAKPHGQLVVESKSAGAWQAMVSVDVRYGATVDGPIWRGEMAIPWAMINDAAHRDQVPAMLRFNFAQHQQTTGQSASWAGPIDFARDEGFMGLLLLRQGP